MFGGSYLIPRSSFGSSLEVVTSLELSDKARDNTKLDLVLNN